MAGAAAVAVGQVLAEFVSNRGDMVDTRVMTRSEQERRIPITQPNEAGERSKRE